MGKTDVCVCFHKHTLGFAQADPQTGALKVWVLWGSIRTGGRLYLLCLCFSYFTTKLLVKLRASLNHLLFGFE